MAGVGLMLPPDRGALALLEPLLEDIDYGEVVPETLWGPDRAPNAFHGILCALAPALPMVAHGVGANLCGVDGEHWPAHLKALARDHRMLRFLWISDHSGAVSLAGQNVAVPVPVPDWSARMRRRLDYLQALVGVAAVENSAIYAAIQGFQEEAQDLGRALGGQHHLVLDLHNLWCNAINSGEDPQRWLDAAPLDRVIELHISGGSDAPHSWSPERRRRMDSHDSAVPEEVWALLEAVLPRCNGLRGVTLERIEGTFGPEHIWQLREELERARALGRGHGVALGEPAVGDLGAALALVAEGESPSEYERALLHALVHREAMEGVSDELGLAIAGRLVLRLRFERLIHGCPEAARDFERDPEGFAGRMARYHRQVPLSATAPWQEAVCWEEWSLGS